MFLLLKNSIKKIFKSFGRFISISLIIFIGIGVFVGLRESTPGMLYTADSYYDDNTMMDFKVTSTYGLTNEDINSLRNLDNVQEVIPTFSSDVLSKGQVIRLHALENKVNNVYLQDGRMPSKNDECLGDVNNYNVGDEIPFDEDNEYLDIKNCKVVGTVKSVLYLNNSYGISNIGDGNISSFAFVKPDIFKYDYYTEAYLLGTNAKDKHSYRQEYQEISDKLKDKLLELKPLRETIRYEQILKEANDEINKIKDELDKEIDKNNKTLISSKKKLDSSKKLLDETKEKTEKEINENQERLDSNKNQIINSLTTSGINYLELDSAISNLKSNIESLKKNQENLPSESLEYNELNITIQELEVQYNKLLNAQSGLLEIEEGLISLNQEKEKFEAEINKQEKSLNDGYKEYYDGVKKLEDAKKEADKKIEEAKEKLNEIEKPVWYLLDRNDISGYQNYKNDSLKVEAISQVLPVFFIIVVALMCLNTLTRLIEEERGEIGILQSNGFSKFSIILSYLYYVLTSTLIGVVGGLTIGYAVISKIIYGVFTANYYLPKYISVVDKTTLSFVIVLTFLLMIVVTVVACNKELKDKPAELLRPKPPKSGKKIFLERFKRLWNSLSFMSKITIRNLFRYKKRIFMTILGVSGCTALLLTGFGLNDSINVISRVQYGNIIKYKSSLILKNEVTDISPKIKELFEENKISDYLLINQNAFTYTYDETNKETVYVVVPSNIDEFNKYISLKSLETDEEIKLSDNGVVISNQMAKQLGVNKGDNINIRNSDNELFIMRVQDIVYNYVSHYIYMSPKTYNEVFKKEISYNNIVTNTELNLDIKLNDYDIYMINNTSDILETFDTFIKSINNLIVLIIICACGLAFAVLYNLTIINVNERKREIATFKVLGFKDGEIFMFIYRETLILSIIGSLVGLVLGKFLHIFVLSKAETGNVLFMCNIEWYSYLLALIITLLFSLIVQLLINKTLKRIDMVDSLKSVE